MKRLLEQLRGLSEKIRIVTPEEAMSEKMIQVQLKLLGRNRYGLLDDVTVMRINVLGAFRDVIDQLFKKYVKRGDKIIDIGSGMGGGYRLKPKWIRAEDWYQLEQHFQAVHSSL